MKSLIYILLTAVILAFLLLPKPVSPESTFPEVERSPIGYLKRYAALYGVSYTTLYKVARCESGLKQSAIGDGGKAIGIFQYHRPTFERFSKEFGEKMDINSYHDQIKLTAWAFKNGHQSHWTCFAKFYGHR